MIGKIFVISAPSGAGKTSLVKALLNRMGNTHQLRRVVTYTSKAPRPGDRSGVDYHFVTPDEFEQKVQDNFFMEWSDAYGAYYGSPRNILDEIKKGTSFVVILDRAGARQVVEQTDRVVPIWIAPPSIEVLEQRLRSRATETEEQIKRRLVIATQEIAQERSDDLYKYHVINDVFDEAVNDLEKIVLDELNN